MAHPKLVMSCPASVLYRRMCKLHRLLLLGCLFSLSTVAASDSIDNLNSSSVVSLPTDITPSSGLILVLGSDGLIGSAVTDWLHAHHYSTLLVHNRSHVDLRIDDALPRYLASQRVRPDDIAYAFFLACEVGGSKFLQSASAATQSSILTHNLAIYRAVLPFFAQHAIPFLFASSYLSHMNTPYGAAKRTGELLVRHLSDRPLGRVVRLWNIYGRERMGGKSHVLTDWVVGCAQSGRVESLSDGLEWRQFLHANDTAAALGGMMQQWQQLPLLTDLSSAQWVQMRQVAQLVAEAALAGAGRQCGTSFAERAEGSGGEEVREKLSPDVSNWWWKHSAWQPTVTMEAGIADLYHFYGKQLQGGAEGERATRASESDQLVDVLWPAAIDGCCGNDSRSLMYPTSSAPPFVVRSAGVLVDGTD